MTTDWLGLFRERVPDGVGSGRPPPVVWLLYLGFLFLPASWGEPATHWLWPTLVSLPPFLFLYVRHLRPGAFSCRDDLHGGLVKNLVIVSLQANSNFLM